MLGLVGVQAADAVFNAVPTQWLRDDLDHLGIPQDLRVVFPVVKGASALGLLGGLRWPRLGRVTAAAMVVYFVLAIGAHARVKDGLLRYTPAGAMLVWSVRALLAFEAELASPPR